MFTASPTKAMRYGSHPMSKQCLCEIINDILPRMTFGISLQHWNFFQVWQFTTGYHLFSSPVPFTVSTMARNKRYVPEASSSSRDTTVDSRSLNLNERTLIGCHDHCGYCLDRNGQLIWKHRMNSAVYATPFILETCLCNTCTIDADISSNFVHYYAVICSTSGQIDIVNCINGRLVCSTNVPGELFSSPVVCDDRLIIGCRDDNIYCFKMNFQHKQH